MHVHGRAAQGRWRESGSSVLPGGTPQLSVAKNLRHSPSLSLSVHTVGQEGSTMFKDVQSIVIYHDIMHFCSRCAKKNYCTVTQQKTYLVANSQVLNGDLIMNQMVMNAMNGCDMSLNFNAH